ncbi:MAG: zinc ribbon domain-containing protein [Pikeienuella sp.]
MAQHCQSCDMPLTKDPEGGGTDADGGRSAEYCSYCYAGGAFTYQGDDVKAFQAYVVDNMVKEGWIRPVAWLFTRRIPKLKRWA